MLVIVLLFFIHTQRHRGDEAKVLFYNKAGALLLFIGITVYMGLRPVSGKYFMDMGVYAKVYEMYQAGDYINWIEGDWLFNIYMKVCSMFLGMHTWFLLTAFIYTGCIYWACKRLFPQYILVAFIMCVTAFSFWGYGTNGIRNGLATSILLLAFSFYNKKWKAILLFILATGMHKSVMLPVLAAVVAYFYHNTKTYTYIWLLCIVASLVLSDSLTSLFSGFSIIDDDRFSAYLNNDEYADSFSSTGFRWDFLLYSMVPIIMGWYVVVKRNKYDSIYSLLLNTYIISNAFWILIIRTSFSNRFAYLSWFLYPLILIYPVIKFDLWNKQYSKSGIVVLLHFIFTYFMNVIK